MSEHVDKFETLCTQMTSCGKTPDEEQKIDWFMASVHEQTYDATHAHCTNKLLEGNLTYAMLIKMYTNQCFRKYPHFQLSDLNENKRFSNNSNRFRSSTGKGKQGKGKGKNREMTPYRKWRDGNKGKRGNQNNQGSRSNEHGQTYTQNSNQTKGKGNGKGSKKKGKGKGKPRYGDRKVAWKDEKNQQDNERKPITNNMQKMYREEPHYLGDDETTIVFTQNATRIIEAKASENKEDDDEIITNENNETSEYEGLSLELASTFERMIKEIMNLPDDHEAWAYMNPTMFYFDDQTSSQNLHEKAAQHVRDFKKWLDGTLFINHEFKEKTKMDHLQPSQDEQPIQAETIEENNFDLKSKEEQESSSVDEKPGNEIRWGERKMNDNEQALNLWLQTNVPHAEKKNGDTNVDTDLEEMTICSVCEREMHKLNLGINTCQGCLQWIRRSTQNNDDYEAKHEKERMAQSQIDDETEFDRIPTAGENESDYEDSDEYEEEEDSILPYLEGEDNDDNNSTDTEDSELQSIPNSRQGPAIHHETRTT